MKWSELIWLVLIALLLPSTVVGQELEKFRLNSNDEPLEAELVSWDFQTGQLSLKKVDGTILEVPAADLHPSDVRLIEKMLKKQWQSAKKDEPNGTVAKTPGYGARGQANRRCAVSWYDNEEDARRVALGSDGTQDDRPMVWFRVLGDLNGFM